MLVRPTILAQEPGDQPDEVRVMQPSTSDIMRKLMRLVVTDGFGKTAEVPGYYPGGKTGTAEKVAAHGGYKKHANVAAFMSVFPMNAPRYAVYMMLDEPHGNKDTYGYATAGWVVAPAAGKVIARIGPMLGMLPDIAGHAGDQPGAGDPAAAGPPAGRARARASGAAAAPATPYGRSRATANDQRNPPATATVAQPDRAGDRAAAGDQPAGTGHQAADGCSCDRHSATARSWPCRRPLPLLLADIMRHRLQHRRRAARAGMRWPIWTSPGSPPTAAMSCRAICSPRCRARASTGAAFIADAVERGAVAVLAPPGTAWPPGVPPRPVIFDPEPRQCLARIAAVLAGPQPETVVAVTGTNGKTSTVEFTRQLWASAGSEGRQPRHAWR